MLENITSEFENQNGIVCNFDAQLAVGEQTVKISVSLDDDGVTLKTKKDNVFFARKDLLNLATIYFANRFFPILLILGAISLADAGFKLVMVIVYSLARKAAGTSTLERTTDALRRGKTDEAIELINSMNGDMTDNPGILMNLARGLTTAGDYEKAGQFADVLTGNFPNFALGYQTKVKVRAALGAEPEEVQRLVDVMLTVTGRNELRSLQRQKLIQGVV